MTKRQLRITLFSLGLLILVFVCRRCGYSLYNSFAEKNLDRTEIAAKKRIASKEYRKIFKTSVLQKIEFSRFDVNKSKHPFWEFKYDRQYEIYVCKLDLSVATTLNDILKIDSGKVNRSGVNYRGSEMDGISFAYSALHDSIINRLNIKYQGELIDSVRLNDSLMFLDIKSDRFGFNYEEDAPVDILFEVEKSYFRDKEMPDRNRFHILILKNVQKIFIVVLRQRTQEDEFKRRFLLGLLDSTIYKD